MDPNRCCESVPVRGSWGYVQCSRRAVVHEDGKGYCRQHAPSAVKAREEAARKEWAEKHEGFLRKRLAERIGNMMMAAGVDTEEKARDLLGSFKQEQG